MSERALREDSLAASADDAASGAQVAAILRGATMRVGAELGRVRLPAAVAAALAAGTVVSLDRRAEDPLELCVNGVPIATGRLMALDERRWAVRIERVYGNAVERSSGADGA